MHVELSNPELWSIFGSIAFLLIIIFRAIIYRTSFSGRALICLSAGLALFAILVWWNFDLLIEIPEMEGNGSYNTHILSNHEITVRYYYWYSAVVALGIGLILNFCWLISEKQKNEAITGMQQARIFSLSIIFGCVTVLLIASFYLT